MNPLAAREEALRTLGREGQRRGYTLEGAYTFATASTGRTLLDDELDAVATGWNAEAALQRGVRGELS